MNIHTPPWLTTEDVLKITYPAAGPTLRRGDAVTLADGSEGTLTELWIEEGSLRMAVTVWRDGARVERVVADPREVTAR